jgi:hypothetical protein
LNIDYLTIMTILNLFNLEKKEQTEAINKIHKNIGEIFPTPFKALNFGVKDEIENETTKDKLFEQEVDHELLEIRRIYAKLPKREQKGIKLKVWIGEYITKFISILFKLITKIYTLPYKKGD